VEFQRKAPGKEKFSEGSRMAEKGGCMATGKVELFFSILMATPAIKTKFQEGKVHRDQSEEKKKKGKENAAETFKPSTTWFKGVSLI